MLTLVILSTNNSNPTFLRSSLSISRYSSFLIDYWSNPGISILGFSRERMSIKNTYSSRSMKPSPSESTKLNSV